jgi:hypothetical protein
LKVTKKSQKSYKVKSYKKTSKKLQEKYKSDYFAERTSKKVVDTGKKNSN